MKPYSFPGEGFSSLFKSFYPEVLRQSSNHSVGSKYTYSAGGLRKKWVLICRGRHAHFLDPVEHRQTWEGCLMTQSLFQIWRVSMILLGSKVRKRKHLPRSSMALLCNYLHAAKQRCSMTLRISSSVYDRRWRHDRMVSKLCGTLVTEERLTYLHNWNHVMDKTRWIT